MLPPVIYLTPGGQRRFRLANIRIIVSGMVTFSAILDSPSHSLALAKLVRKGKEAVSKIS